MRIAFLTPEYVRAGQPDGGLANYLSKLAALLLAKSHEPVVFVPGDGARETCVGGVRVVEVRRFWAPSWFLGGRLSPLRDVAVRWRESGRIVRAFLAEHARQPFDVIQSTSFRSPGLRFWRRQPIPLVVRLSGLRFLVRQGHGIRAGLAERLGEWMELQELRQGDSVFGPSRLHIRTLEERARIKGCVVRSPFYIPPCVEDAALYQQVLAGKRYLLYFGKIDRLKGSDVLAAVLPGILEQHADLHAAFLGLDVERPQGGTYGDLIRGRTQQFADRVHMLGRQPRERVLPVLRAADFVVMPSRMDNCPNTCLEAQALGRIVVGTNGSSLDELIEDGKSGFLSEPGDAESLARAVSAALALNHEAKAQMERAVKESASRRSPDKDAAAHLEVYNRAIAGFGK